MTRNKTISPLFYIGALYDGVLGLIFLLAPLSVFVQFGIEPPNHEGYVQFPAALLLVFTVMFFNIARSPRQNFNLIPYGIGLKISYCSIVFFHWFSSGIPWIWKPFAICDLVFLALFVWAYGAIKKDETLA